jgi:hypothetical protein
MANNFNFTDSGYSPPIIYSFNFGEDSPLSIYTILQGGSNNFVSIWADADAGINDGKFYVSGSGNGAALCVVNLNTQVLSDFYTISHSGRFNDQLDNEDIEDINTI